MRSHLSPGIAWHSYERGLKQLSKGGLTNQGILAQALSKSKDW